MGKKGQENTDFHRLVGGRDRIDLKYYKDPEAGEIRQKVLEIMETTGLNMGQIARRCHVALSIAAGGRVSPDRQAEILKTMRQTFEDESG